MSNPGTTNNSLAVPPPVLPDGHAPVEQAVTQAHANASGQLSKLTQAKSMVSHIREQLDSLATMGEAVTPEDVIKGAGMLVGKGADPMQMASLLADMPQGGQALAAWVQGHDAQLKQNEAQLDAQLDQVRHQAGSAALHVLAMDHIKQKFSAPSAPEESAPNGLAP